MKKYTWALTYQESAVAGSEWYHIYVRLLPITDVGTLYDGGIFHFDDKSLAASLYRLGMYVSSQGTNADADRKLYGIECRFDRLYQPSIGDLLDAQKPLKALDTRLKKTFNQLGTPQSLGEYTALLAAAIGVKRFAQKQIHTPGAFAMHGIDQLRFELGQREYTWSLGNKKTE